MTALRCVIWAVIGIFGILTIWLGALNWKSEKVSTNLPTALAVGFVGAFVTLVYSLQKDEQSQTFPVEFVVDPNTSYPYSCQFFDSMILYADTGFGLGGGWTTVRDLLRTTKYSD